MASSVKAPMVLVRAKRVDLIDDVTTFRGVWHGSVYSLRDWLDCRSGQYVTVESDLSVVRLPRDTAFALRGHYKHWLGEARPLPPEWGIPKGPARPQR